MKITEINNQYCKISKNSITVKDDYNKTIGVVTKLVRFKDLQANKQINFSKTLRSAGIWGNNKIEMDLCYIIDNSIFLLRNTNSDKYRQPEEMEAINAMYKNFENYGVNIIYFRKLA